MAASARSAAAVGTVSATGARLVHVGQRVLAGQSIALVGDAVPSTGCHLHVEVRLDGSPIDPTPFLAARGVTLGR